MVSVEIFQLSLNFNSTFNCRLTSWVMLKVLPCFLTSVVVHPTQVEMLEKAGKSGLPLIFLPLHRSHLDYILVTFILLNIDVKSPMVAAGDNLNIPVFGYDIIINPSNFICTDLSFVLASMKSLFFSDVFCEA